jgi:hypothetical protein
MVIFPRAYGNAVRIRSGLATVTGGKPEAGRQSSCVIPRRNHAVFDYPSLRSVSISRSSHAPEYPSGKVYMIARAIEGAIPDADPHLSSRFVNGRLIRRGYTTGSCAAAAWMLLARSKRKIYSVITAAGITLNLAIQDAACWSGSSPATIWTPPAAFWSALRCTAFPTGCTSKVGKGLAG